MPNVRQFTLPIAGAGFLTIFPSIPCRRVEFVEDEAPGTSPQGFTYQSLMDKFVTTNTVSPGSEPIILGNPVAQGAGIGPLLADPGFGTIGDFNYRSPKPILKVTSATATAVLLRVTEFE